MKILLLILIAYLLGSIQTGLWIGKLFFHTNLREHGSGNTGTTNTFRVLGKTAGTITFLVDMFKGTLAVLLPIWLGVTEAAPRISSSRLRQILTQKDASELANDTLDMAVPYWADLLKGSGITLRSLGFSTTK